MKKVSTAAPLPANVEIEAYVLATMMLDPNAIDLCISERITQSFFTDPRNQEFYTTLLSLRIQGKPTGADALALALSYKMDMPHFLEVTGKAITSTMLGTSVAKLKALKSARDLIVLSQTVIEKANDGADTNDLIADLETRLQALRSKGQIDSRLKPITSFQVPPDDDPSTLLGDRFICRGNGTLFVGGSGMGKSTAAYQASICWALGRHFLGIVPKRPLVSLHIQAEDEDGDIGEVWASVMHGLKLSPQDLAMVEKRVIIKTEKVARGDKFLSEMQTLCAKIKPDLVWVNPLHAYMDGDIKDAEAVGRFCRTGLAGANREDKWAYMIVHHTPKPNVGKDKGEREWNEVMYEAAGSADLVNWARAVMVLKATKQEGQFDLVLAKRGKRAGVITQVTDENGNVDWQVTTKIPIKHSNDKINVPGRSKQMPVMFWEPREPTKEPPKEERTSRSSREPKAPNGWMMLLDFMRENRNVTPSDLMGELHTKGIRNEGIRRKFIQEAVDSGILQYAGAIIKLTDKAMEEINRSLASIE